MAMTSGQLLDWAEYQA